MRFQPQNISSQRAENSFAENGMSEVINRNSEIEEKNSEKLNLNNFLH